MGMPNVIISFKEKSTTAITRSSKGIVGLIVKENITLKGTDGTKASYFIENKNTGIETDGVIITAKKTGIDGNNIKIEFQHVSGEYYNIKTYVSDILVDTKENIIGIGTETGTELDNDYITYSINLEESLLSLSSLLESAELDIELATLYLVGGIDGISSYTAKDYLKKYSNFAEVSSEDYSTENYAIIEDIFKGTPKKLIVLSMPELMTANSTIYSQFLRKRMDYFTFPFANSSEKISAISYFNLSVNEYIKIVLASANAPDSSRVINCTMGFINSDKEIISKERFSARFAGILAGLSQERSSTYYVISEASELIETEIPDDYDIAVDEGKIVLIDDGKKIKVCRGINSLTTLTETVGKSYKKIKIVEAMDLITRDIKDTFEDFYIGKCLNTYINKIQFISAVNIYFKTLTTTGILDPTATNTLDINTKEQLNYIKLNSGLTEDEIDDLDDQTVKEYNTGSSVFLNGKLKIADTMEDLDFPISL